MVNGFDLTKYDAKSIADSDKAINAINEQFGLHLWQRPLPRHPHARALAPADPLGTEENESFSLREIIHAARLPRNWPIYYV